MAFFALRNRQDDTAETIVEENKKESLDTAPIHISDNNDNTSNIEEDSKYMPHMDVEQDLLLESEEELHEIENNPQSEAIAAEESSVDKEEQVNSSIVNKDTTNSQSVENLAALEQVNTEQVINFCRHCGRMLDCQIDKYCKHCGKQLF